MLDLVGEKYGLLTVLEEAPRKGQARVWRCLCDCGNVVDVRQSDLRSGKTLSCGCLGKQKRAEGKRIAIEQHGWEPKPREDLTGKVFGRLTVLKFDKEYTLKRNEPGKLYWKCLCECGNTVYVKTANLKFGTTKSCGCLQKDSASTCMKNYVQPISVQKNTSNLTGAVFGKLTVLGLDTKRSGKGQGSFWLCRCECGTEKSIAYYSLVSGATRSCGCLGKSIGEHTIAKILKDNNINFQKEVKFDDLKDETYLRFDFGIYDSHNNLIKLIEYNGRQHTDKASLWHTEKVIKHDKMKIDYCKKHNIKLLVINYQDLDKINLEFLLNQ